MLIWCLRKNLYYYQCWKHLCCTIFLQLIINYGDCFLQIQCFSKTDIFHSRKWLLILYNSSKAVINESTNMLICVLRCCFPLPPHLKSLCFHFWWGQRCMWGHWCSDCFSRAAGGCVPQWLWAVWRWLGFRSLC